MDLLESLPGGRQVTLRPVGWQPPAVQEQLCPLNRPQDETMDLPGHRSCSVRGDLGDL